MNQKRLQQLENNIRELKKIRNSWDIGDIKGDKSKEWSLRYGLLESLQVVIDIACHQVAEKNMGSAETYSECFELLKENGYIDEEMNDTFKRMVGVRNILVHEYVTVDLDRLYGMLNQLDDFSKFAQIARNKFK